VYFAVVEVLVSESNNVTTPAQWCLLNVYFAWNTKHSLPHNMAASTWWPWIRNLVILLHLIYSFSSNFCAYDKWKLSKIDKTATIQSPSMVRVHWTIRRTTQLPTWSMNAIEEITRFVCMFLIQYNTLCTVLVLLRDMATLLYLRIHARRASVD